MQTWQLQYAKARLSEVLKCAEADGPQQITVHGRPVAVLISRADYDRLSGRATSLVEFIRASPLAGLDDELVFERDRSPTRDIAL